MTQIASRPLYIWWTLSFLWMTLVLGLVTSAVCFDSFSSLALKGLLFSTVFTVVAFLGIGFGFRFWKNLAHTVLLENGSHIRLISWQESRCVPVTASLRVREKSFGKILVIVLEDSGKVLGKYFPPLDRYREIRAHGAGHYWRGLQDPQTALGA